MFGKEFLLFMESENPRRANKGFLAFTLFEGLKLPSSDSKHILYVERWFQYKEKNSSMFCDALQVI